MNLGVFPPTKKRDRRNRDRVVWKCVYDPSGDFLGSNFRLLDIRAGGFELGTKFKNTDTGEEIVYDLLG